MSRVSPSRPGPGQAIELCSSVLDPRVRMINLPTVDPNWPKAAARQRESTFPHTIAVDSTVIHAAETVGGRRLQRLKATGAQK